MKPIEYAPEKPRRPCLEAVLIKPAEGMSLRDPKRCVNSDELGVKVQGIRETRSKDLLVKLKYPKEGRGWLHFAFQEASRFRG